jgi:hypothetical protein
LKIAVIDSNYTKGEFVGLAASWLRWELQQAGIVEVAPAEAEFLLCTVSSQQGIADLRRAVKRTGNKTARVVVGGGGAWAPAVFDGLASVCCVGEGARFVRTFLDAGYDAACQLPEAWQPGAARQVVPSEGFPWECPPIRHPDGTIRLFGSRGCKYRCLFCQTGWEASYRVNPRPNTLRMSARALEQKKQRVAIITNDGAEQSMFFSGQQEFLSMRLGSLRRFMQGTHLDRSVAKSVRLGVEGVSERLRRAVAKPVDNRDLLETTALLISRGVGVRWFFVAGLPGETAADWLELRGLIDGLRQMEKGCVMLNFHAFIPQPATPLCIFPLVDEYWEQFEEFRRWFFHGPGFTRRCQIVAPAQYSGRMQRAMESMAATENELRRGWWVDKNKNWRVEYPASPDELRRVARCYESRIMVKQ